MLPITFDIISDLNLSDGMKFDWSEHVTSPYCIVAGNVSQHLDIVRSTLHHLSEIYAAVFYVEGSLEHPDTEVAEETMAVIKKFCRELQNVYYLYGQAIVVNNIAVMGLNGWYANRAVTDENDMLRTEILRLESLRYLNKTVESLQRHQDVRQIVMVTGCIPAQELMFGETQYASVPEPLGPAQAMAYDTERKIKTWVYGGYPRDNDVEVAGVRYISNPCLGRNPYWAKVLSVTLQVQP